MPTHINKMPRLKRKNNRSKRKVSCRCRACSMKKDRPWGAVTSHTLEAFLILMLLFMLPPAVCGIVDNTQQTAIEQKSAQQQQGKTTMIGKNQPQSELQTTFDHSKPHFEMNRTGIVELFEWKFTDVAKECEIFLGPKGYAGVQLSPVTEHLQAGSYAQTWLTLYQPISYKFATRLGSIENFLEMSRSCNAAGVRVYVDVVFNHMVGEMSNETLLEGIAGSVANVSALEYTGVPFSAKHFHKPCPIENYLNTYEVRNCQLNGQPDLDQSQVEVRQRIVALLNGLIDMGVAGFRIDSAKYIWPMDLGNIFSAINNLNSEEFDFPADSRPFLYQEVVDLGLDSVSKTEYAGYGIVTEYLYAAELSTIFRGKVPLSTLINWGPAMGFLPHKDALVFVDTHESQHGYLERELGQNQLLSFRHRRQHVMATVFMLAHPYGHIKRIMSSYYYDENKKESAPPMIVEANNDNVEIAGGKEESNEVIRSPEFNANQQCIEESGWVCEHRWPSIVNMLTLVNVLSPTEDGISNFQTFGPNHIAFCRGQKAFIAFNNDALMDYVTTVHTCLEPGVYCDVISGGVKADGSDCNGKRIVVNEHGMADLELVAIGNEDNKEQLDGDKIEVFDIDYGVIAIYTGSKLVIGETDAQFEMKALEMHSTTIEPSDEVAETKSVNSDTSTDEPAKVDKR